MEKLVAPHNSIPRVWWQLTLASLPRGELLFFLFSRFSQWSLGQSQDTHDLSVETLGGYMLVMDLRITAYISSAIPVGSKENLFS